MTRGDAITEVQAALSQLKALIPLNVVASNLEKIAFNIIYEAKPWEGKCTPAKTSRKT